MTALLLAVVRSVCSSTQPPRLAKFTLHPPKAVSSLPLVTYDDLPDELHDKVPFLFQLCSCEHVVFDCFLYSRLFSYLLYLFYRYTSLFFSNVV